MDPHDDIVLGSVGVGHVRQGQSTDAGIAVSNGDGLHDSISFCTGDCRTVLTRRGPRGMPLLRLCSSNHEIAHNVADDLVLGVDPDVHHGLATRETWASASSTSSLDISPSAHA